MGERVDINRFFAEVNRKMIEIDKEEYDARKEIKLK